MEASIQLSLWGQAAWPQPIGVTTTSQIVPWRRSKTSSWKAWWTSHLETVCFSFFLRFQVFKASQNLIASLLQICQHQCHHFNVNHLFHMGILCLDHHLFHKNYQTNNSQTFWSFEILKILSQTVCKNIASSHFNQKNKHFYFFYLISFYRSLFQIKLLSGIKIKEYYLPIMS